MSTITAAPQHDPRGAQRLAALRKANRVRSARGAARRDLAAGRITWEQALHHPDCATATAWTLALTVPHIGRVTAERAFRRTGISPAKRIGTLTDRQIDALTRELARTPARARAVGREATR